MVLTGRCCVAKVGHSSHGEMLCGRGGSWFSRGDVVWQRWVIVLMGRCCVAEVGAVFHRRMSCD